MTTLLDPSLRHQKMMEQTQRAIKKSEAALYESKKITADNHKNGCTCDVCEWVDNYEWEMSTKWSDAWENCFE